MTNVIENQNQPLASLDEWEDDLLRRYPNPEDIATS
jgi:inositol oxygenase